MLDMPAPGGLKGEPHCRGHRWWRPFVLVTAAAVLLLTGLALLKAPQWRRWLLHGDPCLHREQTAAASAAATGAPLCDREQLSRLLNSRAASWSGPSKRQLDANGTAWECVTPQASLKLRQCRLRQFTAAQARACLAAKPLVMIGDSITRYQYLSLLYFLEFERWPGLGSPGHPSPVIERDWEGGWPTFFKGTTAPFRGRQQCHCFREGWDMREDRFYSLEAGGPVAAAFYMWMGYPLKPVLGRWGFPPHRNATACTPGDCGGDADWALPLQDALPKVIARFKPHTIVFNSGLWRSKDGLQWPPETYDAIMAAASEAVRPQGGSCIWKTTTYSSDGHVPREWDDVALGHAAKHGWRVMDAFALTQPLMQLQPRPYTDNLHFYGYVYESLNQYLLNLVC